MYDLIPSPGSVMHILAQTGAYRKGHFVYPGGKHASHYFQMPLAFRYYNNARVLSVGLSRMLRMTQSISSRLPKVSVISPSAGGIMVAFGVREALGAEQVYWAEQDGGKRQFRQFLEKGMVHPAIIVDDILRSGGAITDTVNLVREIGAEVIGIGTILKFKDAPSEFAGIPVKALLEFDVNLYDSEDDWKKSDDASDAPAESVR